MKAMALIGSKKNKMGKHILFLTENLNTLMCIYYGHEQCLVCCKNGLRTDNLLLIHSVIMERGRKIMIQRYSLVRNLLILMLCFIILKDRTIGLYPDSKQMTQLYHRIILQSSIHQNLVSTSE